MRSWISGSTVAILALASQPASAATYLLDYTAYSGTFSGSFTTTDAADSNGYYTITDFSGTKNGSAITWDSSYLPGDGNLFKTDDPYFNSAGVRYTVGSSVYFLYAYSDLLECSGTSAGCTYGPVTQVSITAVPTPAPEPSVWAMFIGGFGLLGGALRRARIDRRNVRFA